VSVKGGEAPPYFLVADDIRKDDAMHEYAWLLHTDSTNVIDHSNNPVLISGHQSSMQVVFVNPQAINGLQLDSWPFAHGGEDPASTVLRARRTAVEPAFFVALLPANGTRPRPTIVSGPHGVTNASELTLLWGNIRDDAVFNPGRVQLSGAIGTNGRLAFVRSSASGPQEYLLADGSLLRFQNQTLLLLGDTATVILSGNTLHLSRQDVSFVAYGNFVDQVVGPDGPIPFIQEMGLVRSDLVTDALARETEMSPLPVLDVNTPNPFNAGTRLQYTLPRAGPVRVQIFDARGRLVRVLVDSVRPAGDAQVFWDGTDEQGGRQASGTYIVQLQTAGHTISRKVVLVR
jgi:hypothetical protein